MYRNKKEVDKHVEHLMYKLLPKDFKNRAYSIARLYYDVGDYGSCQKYVTQYLSQKPNNAAAHKLLASALLKLGEKEKALEEFQTSLNIDPTQTGTILDVCLLLADKEVEIKPGQVKYWCEKAEAIFPKHPIIFDLKERVLAEVNPDPEALENLLKSELTARPKDAVLHARLIKHYLHTSQLREAFDHSYNVEFDNSYFSNNFAWYETINEILKFNPLNNTDWTYQLLLLTVKEKLCHLSLSEIPNSITKRLLECYDYLFAYDQAIESISKAGSPPGFGEFFTNLLQHHRGQLAFHAGTYLLKKAKKDQLNWTEAAKYSAPLMLKAWQIPPVDAKANWLSHAPTKQQKAAKQWYLEGCYRCSQTGHYILSNIQAKNYLSLDQISQLCSVNHWRDKLFEKIFTDREHLGKIQTSHLASATFTTPIIQLPRKSEVQEYDENAQRLYPNSLHHFVWILLNYEDLSVFKCTVFDMLTSSMISCGPESLNKLDVQSFLYCATLSIKNKLTDGNNYKSKDKPKILPANITQLLCSLPQVKWWDCAYKLSQNELGSDYTDIRSTLSRGIEVVRCMDNHGLDPELICHLGRIFSNIAKTTLKTEEQRNIESRALLYYSAALPLLENLKCKISGKPTNRQMFDYVHKNLDVKALNVLLEESKIYVALNLLNNDQYDKVIELLSDLKSPHAYYQLGVAYKNIALEERKHLDSSIQSNKYLIMLSKAKQFAYKGLHKVKEIDLYQSTELYTDIQTLIENIEVLFNKVDVNILNTTHNNESKSSSDETDSLAYGEPFTPINQKGVYRNVSSTPKQTLKHGLDADSYSTAVDLQLEKTHINMSHVERIEKQIRSIQKRDTTISDFMEQTKEWFDENRKLGNQIISSINSNIEHTTEQFKLLRFSIGQVKEQIDECKIECKDVADLKKEIADLKKEVNKLKKPSSEQSIDDSELFNLEEEYRNNENQSTFNTQLPFTPHQVIAPPLAQRLVPPFPLPPNPYQLYGQNFYNLYNQYSQFSQTPGVPAAQQLFDPTRAQMNYPSVYTTPDQMYLDVAHLVSSNMTGTASGQAPPVSVPSISVIQNTTASKPPVSVATPSTIFPSAKSSFAMELKDMGKSLPANVVITSSDPLPSCTTTPAPVLSVTIPPKHIKNSPHNYQITLPPTSDVKLVKPPVYSFNVPSNEVHAASITTVSNINQQSLYVTTQVNNTNNENSVVTSVVDGIFSGPSLNTSLNKSRTYSEKSNTSIENYDPCPDFKPIVPLPAEVTVTTGEEDESIIFQARAKLFRFVSKQWKERGIGEMKLLKHAVTGKVRVLMRREQVHKICANHVILPEMEIKPMKNETKAYFWVANDFAEESIILEKFCVRFKTAEIALDFYKAFEKARQETVTMVNTSKTFDSPNAKVGKPESSTTMQMTNSAPLIKTVVGGFTFSSTPTFKTTTEKTTQPSEVANTKVNVFSGLSFKNNNSSLQNIFNITPNTVDVAKTQDKNCDNASKLNSSDTVEEYEPNVEFKPVVPLPALIDQKTGEEEENILFEHRAKLLRFDAATKEWKERGLGNIKLLEHKDNNKKIRLLMRREQIMKICCNHAITKEMTFQKMPNMDKAVTWCAKDYSDGELVGETFCLRFKTVQACNEFIEAVKHAQSKIGDGTKAAKEEKNAAKVAASTSSQDLQKSKDFIKSSNWGEQFKPKAGSWECSSCLIRNDARFDHCSACKSPKDPSVKKSDNPVVTDTESKFNFGIQNQTTTTKESMPVTSKWGDKFKPKEGTWQCEQCYVRNESNVENCSACNEPKDNKGSKTEPESKSLFSNTSGPKFNFGIPQNSTNTINQSTVLNLATTTANQKFSFGIPTHTKEINLNVQSTNVNNIKTSTKEEPVNLSILEKHEKITKANITTSQPLQDTPKMISSFGENKNATFGFTFTPKASSKTKSPAKSPKGGNVDSDDEYASEDEGNHIHFSPIIPLPDKVAVVTGEENEEELYAHRAKLYRFTSVEWKERGIGIVKILKHKTTGKLRILMRREQVLKICLNHALTPEIIYNPKDEKTWIFAANDFSDGELVISQFCLRFASKEIALQFKTAVDQALSSLSDDKTKSSQNSDDVVFVSEIQCTSEEKQKAKDLMLPENFYTYKNKSPCRGCRGCDDVDKKTDNETEPAIPKSSSEPKPTDFVTPAKTKISLFQSPTNSIYSSPFDTTIFRTPLGSILSNTAASANSTIDNLSENSSNNTTAYNTVLLDTLNLSTTNNKDNSGFVNTKPITEESTKIIDTKPQFATDKLLFNNKTLFSGNQSVSGDNNSIFSQNKSVGDNSTGTVTVGDSKPLFSSGKFIFGDNNSVSGENKSIFGEKKSAVAENKLLFGPSIRSLGSGENKNIFGEGKSVFGEPKSVFGENQIPYGGNKSVFEIAKPVEVKPIISESGPPLGETKSIFGETKPNFGGIQPKDGEDKPTFGETKSILKESKFSTAGSNITFGKSNPLFGESKPASAASETKSVFGDTKSIFGENKTFGQTSNKLTFGFNILNDKKNSESSNPTNIFGGASQKSIFDNKGTSGNSLLGSSVPQFTFGNNNFEQNSTQSVFPKVVSTAENVTNANMPLINTNSIGFAELSSASAVFEKTPTKSDFKWEGAGQPLFGGAQNKANKTKGENITDDNNTTADESVQEAGAEEDYDPHYEPIVPLPDEIIVTTGEEDEEKLFGQRSKLYRYDDKTREWKERGVGELKILYHSVRKSYRLLLRREQVHKLVLNMLLFTDLKLLPMKNSNCAWTWAGRNYAESAGEQETLAVRFKSLDLANAFYEKVQECLKKLQETIPETKTEKEIENQNNTAKPLRMPKHLETLDRADEAIASHSIPAEDVRLSSQQESNAECSGDTSRETAENEGSEEEEDDEKDECYQEYDNEYSDGYYNYEDDEETMHYQGKVILLKDGVRTVSEISHVVVTFDQELQTPKIIITDDESGETLADIHIENCTNITLSDQTCSWSGMDAITEAEVSAQVIFADRDSAIKFYDNCEMTKAATYSGLE